MRKDLIAYSVLLICGLVVTYYSSLPSDTTKVDLTEWYKVDQKTVQEIKLEGKNLKISATKRENRDDFWINMEKPNAKGEPTKDGFKAHAGFSSALNSFANFYVIRVIGKVEEKDLSEYGLKDEDTTLSVVTSNAKNLILKLGKKPFASSNIYALDTSNQNVILFDATELSKLQNAEYTLYSRNILEVQFNKVTTVAITHNDKVTTLHKLSANAKTGLLEWSNDGESGKPNASWSTWLDKIVKVQLTQYQQEVTQESSKNLVAVLTLSFSDKDTVVDEMKVLKSADGKDYYVTSNHLGSYAKLDVSKFELLLKDLSAMTL